MTNSELINKLWASDDASALTNQAARALEASEQKVKSAEEMAVFAWKLVEQLWKQCQGHDREALLTKYTHSIDLAFKLVSMVEKFDSGKAVPVRLFPKGDNITCLMVAFPSESHVICYDLDKQGYHGVKVECDTLFSSDITFLKSKGLGSVAEVYLNSGAVEQHDTRIVTPDIDGDLISEGLKVVCINDKFDADCEDDCDLVLNKEYTVNSIYDEDGLICPMVVVEGSENGPFMNTRFKLV